MDNIKRLKDSLYHWGASLVGFSKVDSYLPARYVDLPYAISMAIRLSDRVIDEIEAAPTYTYFHHYRSVNTLIDQITLKAGLLIQQWGYHYIAVPASQTVKDVSDPYSGIFQHKTAAVLSGMGWIGKSGLLVTPEYGPCIRLGTILTDMPLPTVDVIIKDKCGSCNLCTTSCPAMAIKGNHWDKEKGRAHILDAHACSRYMKDKFQHIGRGSVCGICIKVCPWGSKLKDGSSCLNNQKQD